MSGTRFSPGCWRLLFLFFGCWPMCGPGFAAPAMSLESATPSAPVETVTSPAPRPSIRLAPDKPVAFVPEAFRPAARLAGEEVLWDQPLSTENLFPYADQDFETAQNAFDIFLADDFTSTRSWEIRSIFLPGYTESSVCDLHCADSLNFQIYGDAGGVPNGHPDGGLGGGANPPLWSLSVSPSDPQITLEPGPSSLDSYVTLVLASPLQLPRGTYWFVFYPTMETPPPTGSCCQYYRFASDTTHGTAAQVINPGGGLGFPTAWTSMQSPSTWSMQQQDIAFRMTGVAQRTMALPPITSLLLGE